MNKTNKLLVFILAILVIAVLGYVVFTPSSHPAEEELANNEETNQETEPILEYQIIIDGEMYEMQTPVGATAYDMMVEAERRGILTYVGEEFEGMGFLVEKINGLAGDEEAGTYWTFYVNDEMSMVGVSDYVIQEGDVPEWRYEAASF